MVTHNISWSDVGPVVGLERACVGLPDRKSQSMLRGVQIILARIRLEHKYNDNVTVRFHSDSGVGSTVEGEMSATIPSDISVMMDIDLRRHHEQSGAWSKKGWRIWREGGTLRAPVSIMSS